MHIDTVCPEWLLLDQESAQGGVVGWRQRVTPVSCLKLTRPEQRLGVSQDCIVVAHGFGSMNEASTERDQDNWTIRLSSFHQPTQQVQNGPEREEIEVARSAAWTLARDGVGLGPPVVL